MSIFFAVLKIIGILLLAILFLLGLLLFHPVFYRIEGKIEEDISLKGHFWWLFQIVRVEFEIKNAGIDFCFRLFGIRKTSKEETSDGAEEEEAPGPLGCPQAEEASEPADAPESAGHLQTSGGSESFGHLQTSDVPGRKKKKARRSESVSPHREKDRETKDRRRIFETVKRELTDERNHQALSHVWKEILYLLAHLKPNYIKTELFFSTGDSALTGQVTGALSLLPIVYRYPAHIYPDFTAEKGYIRGTFHIKGHMALYHLALIFIRVFWDRNIRKIFYKLRKQEV